MIGECRAAAEELIPVPAAEVFRLGDHDRGAFARDGEQGASDEVIASLLGGTVRGGGWGSFCWHRGSYPSQFHDMPEFERRPSRAILGRSGHPRLGGTDGDEKVAEVDPALRGHDVGSDVPLNPIVVLIREHGEEEERSARHGLQPGVAQRLTSKRRLLE